MTVTKKIVIAGAGDFGKELYQWVRSSLKADEELLGFIDDDRNVLDSTPLKGKIFASISDYKPESDHRLLISISKPDAKLKVVEALEAKGAEFTTFVHPSVILGDEVVLGKGVVMCPNSVASYNANIQDFVCINLGTTIGHDTKIGKGSTLSSQVDICGYAEIGEGVFIGSKATVSPKVKVGNFAKIGAGSVLLKNVKENTFVMGNPAKRINLG